MMDIHMQELLRATSPLVEMTVAAERMETCEGCENLQVTRTCAICHCFMPAKVRLKGTSCPRGLW